MNMFVCACYWSCILLLICVFVPVDGGWTPWSVWSDCSVTCGHGTRIRSHACINPPPRNNGSDCLGPERETQDCPNLPCLGLFTDFFAIYHHVVLARYILYSEHSNTAQVCCCHWRYCLQMIFVPGLHGHHVPKAVARVQCHGVECVCAKQQEMQCVQLRSRQRETDKRINCVTNSPAQVSNSVFSVSFLHHKPAALHKKPHQGLTPATFSTILIWWFTNKILFSVNHL